MESEIKFKVAVAQLRPVSTTQQAVDKIRETAKKAALKDVRLVLFPEAYIGGYPRGSSFDTLVGHRGDQGRDEFRQYWEKAIEVPGPYCDQIAEIAKDNQLQLV